MSLTARADFAEYDRLLAMSVLLFPVLVGVCLGCFVGIAFVNDAHVHLLYVHGGLLSPHWKSTRTST
jgi:hypothetical protein